MIRDRDSHEYAKFVEVGPSHSAVLTNDVTMASNLLQVSAETVSFTAGAAGTTGVVGLDKAPVYDSTGTLLGALGSTSFAWVTGTVLTREVAIDNSVSQTAFLASLSNGDYAIDYITGKLYYKKATTGTSDTANYKTRQLNVEVTAAGVGADVNIKQVGGTAVPAMNAAFGTATPLVPIAAKYMATPTTYDDGDAVPILTDAQGRITLSSDIEIGAVELKNGADDTRGIIKAGNTAAVADVALLVADANVASALSSVAVPTTLTGGEKTVAATGTAEALGASLATKSIYIRAKSTNTGNVYVGDSAVDATTSQQIILAANDSLTLDISNRATVYVDAAVNGEGVDYLCMA